MYKYLIPPVEYTLLILGTIYAQKWAANIFLLYTWFSIILLLPIYGLIVVLVFFAPKLDDKALREFSKAVNPTFWSRLRRFMQFAEIALMAAYGWMITAAAALFTILLLMFASNFIREGLAKRKTDKPSSNPHESAHAE